MSIFHLFNHNISINIVDICIYKVYTIYSGGDNMEARLQKWGNSDGIRIPSNLLKLIDLKTNDKVDLNYEDNKIIISKPKKEKISLEEKFKEYHGKNLSKDFEWDEARGKEIW